jgi:hypothetical protein
MNNSVSGSGFRVPGRSTVLCAALLLVAGCNGKGKSNGKIAKLSSEKLILAQVVDEANALAWAGQVEGRALDLLLGKKITVGAEYGFFPDHEQLMKTPAEHRGRPTRFAGKLVNVEELAYREDCARLGKLFRGVVVLADGKMIAFVCSAEREPTKEAVGAGMKIAVSMPPKGASITLAGRFLKRWVALDAAGRDYVVMPLIAAQTVRELPASGSDPMAGLKAPAGKLPLKLIPAPEVWRRPVLEVSSTGKLRLDGKRISWDGLHEAVYPLAAKYRNPLGESALAVVVLCDPKAPEDIRERARKFPRSHGARCIFRMLKPSTK